MNDRCSWGRQHDWGEKFTPPAGLDIEGRRMLALNLRVNHRRDDRDAFLAILAGSDVEACKRCGRVRRAE